MTVLVDAGPVIASADRRDPAGPGARAWLEATPELLVVPAQVTAEIDYLLGERVGQRARLEFLEALARGTLRVACLQPGDYDTVIALERQYDDLKPGLADLSLVVLAARHDTRRILTFDRRHFRAMTPLQGGSFELLP